MSSRQARCDHCGSTHEATPAHQDRFSGAQLWAVVCDQDWLTEYLTEEALLPQLHELLGTPDARGFYRDWGLA